MCQDADCRVHMEWMKARGVFQVISLPVGFLVQNSHAHVLYWIGYWMFCDADFCWNHHRYWIIFMWCRWQNHNVRARWDKCGLSKYEGCLKFAYGNVLSFELCDMIRWIRLLNSITCLSLGIWFKLGMLLYLYWLRENVFVSNSVSTLQYLGIVIANTIGNQWSFVSFLCCSAQFWGSYCDGGTSRLSHLSSFSSHLTVIIGENLLLSFFSFTLNPKFCKVSSLHS